MDLLNEERNYNGIIESIEEITGVSRVNFAYKRTRNHDEVLLRTILIGMCKDEMSWTITKIRDKIGFKNHTTILYALRKIKTWREMPHMYKREINLLKLVKNKYGQKYAEITGDAFS